MSFQIQQNLTSVNCEWGCNSPQWIIIHNTANGTSAAGTAYNNTQYFQSYRGASAHYFVDDGDTVWQCVNDWDTAWHIGDSWSRNGATNYNAIGIEVCETADGSFTEHEISVLQWLVPMLMERYGIGADHLARHHDCTTKICPAGYIDWDRWCWLKDRILSGQQEDEVREEDINAIVDRVCDRLIAVLPDRCADATNWKHYTVNGQDGWTAGGAMANMANDVWYKDLAGVRACDRVVGTDIAANNVNNNLPKIAEAVANPADAKAIAQEVQNKVNESLEKIELNVNVKE